MARHLQLGKRGEEEGVKFLLENGYAILERNWRFGRWEVDVIAHKNEVLHFIEVKTRSSKKYGMPEEHVGNKKIMNLIHAAEEYLYFNHQWKRIQFDILSIRYFYAQHCSVYLIEDVFL